MTTAPSSRSEHNLTVFCIDEIVPGYVVYLVNMITMEDGVVDAIVIESGQHKMGWMADFPPLLASSVFYL